MERIEREIIEINNLEAFVKVKADALGIGKVQFAFVSFDKNTNKSKDSIDCFLDIADAMLLSTDILSGKIAALADMKKKEAAANGSKYAAACYSSTLGGVNEEIAKKRGRTDGKAISRKFDIVPGMKKPFVFTAYQSAGKTDEKGLIQPVGKPEIIIRVAMDANEIKKLAVMIQTDVQAFLTAAYISGEFNSKYNPSNTK